MADTKLATKDAVPEQAAGGADSAGSTAADEKPLKGQKKTADGKPLMHIRVSSPFKIFFDDDALSLSGSNATGPFDILPHHHNFISLLGEGELAVRLVGGATTRVKISGGIMHVRADEVIVFLNV